tara:strand:- start:2541 stop:2741 length:201 start_codon:yes stop_codon:yes gene_type:complete
MLLRRFLHDRKLPSVTGKVQPILKKIGTISPKKIYKNKNKNLIKNEVYGHFKNLNDVIIASKNKYI